MTDSLRTDLAAAAALDPVYPPDRFGGRGIVICAGGARLFTCAWVEIALLRRHLGCTLPIEVWHIGSGELGPPMSGLLEELGVQVVDALAVARRHPVARLGGWELKAYALLHSRFREVLLLDADNVPVRDPAFLFEAPAYQASGALFWPDLVRLARDNPIWALTGLAFRDAPAFESGQIVVDKARGWRALVLAHWINQRSETFYKFLHGDKDTFQIAWLMTGQTFHVVAHMPRLIEHTMCQRDPAGAVVFQHRNGAKWILHGDNPAIEGFRLQSECLALLDELRSIWDGTVFNPSARSAEAIRIEGQLIQQRRFWLTRVSSDTAPIELLPDHRTGSGAPHRLLCWHVRDGEAEPELVLGSAGRADCVLVRAADDFWRGRWQRAPGMPAELAPAIADVAAPPHVAAVDAERDALVALLDRIIATFASLPWDGQIARDLLGTLRTLATIEPVLAQRLRALLRSGTTGTVAEQACAEVIRRALNDPAREAPGQETLTEAADGGAPLPGNSWPQPAFRFGPELYVRNRGR
jgi:hypothetical protein